MRNWFDHVSFVAGLVFLLFGMLTGATWIGAKFFGDVPTTVRESYIFTFLTCIFFGSAFGIISRLRFRDYQDERRLNRAVCPK